MDREALIESAVEFAVGAADAFQSSELERFLASTDQESRRQVAELLDLAAILSLPLAQNPPASLRAKLLAKANPPPPAISPLSFVAKDDPTGWISLPVPGASLKLLSTDSRRGYAVVIGKLEAGSRYPSHTHCGPEDVYVVSGDLVIGTTRLQAGDFHHAEAGSLHDINYSETGCTVIVVLTLEDLQAQFAAVA